MHFGQTGTGYVNPIQPIGNEDACGFLAATAWPTPTMRLALSNQLACPGYVSPATCAPKRPDFYQSWPGSYPKGPIDAYHEPWPTSAKPLPGSPILTDGRGGYVVAQPQLPAASRGVATTPSQAVTEAALQAGAPGTGRAWLWLLLAGLGISYAATRKGRA